MADSSLYPRGKKPIAVTIGDADNPVVNIKVVNNATIYELADGTIVNAGAAVPAAAPTSSVNTTELRAQMLTYAIIMGED